MQRKASSPSTLSRATADKVESANNTERHETLFTCNIPLRMSVLQRVLGPHPKVGLGPTDPLWHVLGRFKTEIRCMRAEPSTARASNGGPVCRFRTESVRCASSTSSIAELARLALVRQSQFMALFADHDRRGGRSANRLRAAAIARRERVFTRRPNSSNSRARISLSSRFVA